MDNQSRAFGIFIGLICAIALIIYLASVHRG